MGPFGSPFTFTGEMTDANGLVYLRARYYHPELGVFPSLDPVEGSAQQAMLLNRYGYVAGNVINAVDPSGQILEAPELWDICEQKNNNYDDKKICPWEGQSIGQDRCRYTYEPDDAIEYAERWKDPNNPNPLFGDLGQDCANFVSQVILAGGLPMNARWYCKGLKCIKGKTSSWTNAKLDSGSLQDYLYQLTKKAHVPHADYWPSELQELGPVEGVRNDEVEKAVKALGAALHSNAVEKGDVLYTLGSRPHVAIIVGWGEYVVTWAKARKTVGELHSQYSPEYPVPYVIDHGVHKGEDSSARPYYALMWASPSGGDFIEVTALGFTKVPLSHEWDLAEVREYAPSFTKDAMLLGLPKLPELP